MDLDSDSNSESESESASASHFSGPFIWIGGVAIPVHNCSPAHASLLSHSKKSNLPVSVKLNQDKTRVMDVTIPLQVRVDEIIETNPNDKVQVQVFPSAALHFLSKSSPSFSSLMEKLTLAKNQHLSILITEDDDHFILHVAVLSSNPSIESSHSFNATIDSADDFDATPTRGGPSRGSVPSKAATKKPGQTGGGGTGGGSVSQSQVKSMFSKVNAMSCDPKNPSGSCIPFKYPDDGCWGRASAMARVIAGAGVAVKKAWTYGNLYANTANNPACKVTWGYHVAPVIQVGSTQYIIDPSMFNGPVTLAQWKSAQHDPNIQSEITDAKVFQTAKVTKGAASYDPNYSQTATVISTYQGILRQRVQQQGPPPYAKCPKS